MKKQKVIIVGAGLSGPLLAVLMARKGFQVDLYERRADMRKVAMSAGRSINLALSDRGIAALSKIGMDEYMLREAVPMRGRMIHTVKGDLSLQPYSGRKGEFINSVSRGGLNIALMNKAEEYNEVNIHFSMRCTGINVQTGEVEFVNEESGAKSLVKGDTVIATDGGGSAIRNSMLNGGVERFNFSQKFLEHGYKELAIPPGPGGSFRIEKNALHIWPRGSFMMIALPNYDGSFTVTLFQDFEGAEGLNNLNTKEKVAAFFKKYFPDAIPHMPTYIEDFMENPNGGLGTIKCFPWHVGGKSVLLGDAAHAVVPFYGQGMNCSFEDCLALDESIDKIGTDWEKVFVEYEKMRKVNTDAIADLAEENFYEMRDKVADPVFALKRQVEASLEEQYPSFRSKYSLVTFSKDVPYSVAMNRGRKQDEILLDICAKTNSFEKIDLKKVLERMEKEVMI